MTSTDQCELKFVVPATTTLSDGVGPRLLRTSQYAPSREPGAAGTISLRHFAAGASMPWYLNACRLGAGTSAALPFAGEARATRCEAIGSRVAVPVRSMRGARSCG